MYRSWIHLWHLRSCIDLEYIYDTYKRSCTHHVCIFSFLRIVQKKQRMQTSNNKCLSGVKGGWGKRRKMCRWFFRWFPICVYRDSCPVLCRNRELLAKSPHHRTCGFSVSSIWISIKLLPSKCSLDSLILKDRWNKTNKWKPKLTSQSTSEVSVALGHREVIEDRSP